MGDVIARAIANKAINVFSGGVRNNWDKVIIENFSNLNGWSFGQRALPEGQVPTGWAVAGGVLTTPLIPGATSLYGTLNNVELADGRVQLIYENPDPAQNSGYVGIAFRGRATNDLIGVILNAGEKYLDCYKLPPSGALGAPLISSNLANYPESTAVAGTPMQLEVEILGTTIKAWVNGRLMFTLKHADLLNYTTARMVGIVCDGGKRSYQISNFSVKKKRIDLINPSTLKTGAAIGSSITFGSGSTPGQNNSNSWVRRFKDNWNASYGRNTLNMINAGIEGNTTTQMIARFDADVLAYNPDFVIIEASPNDLRTDQLPVNWDITIDNLRKMIQKTKGAGAIPLLTSPTPIYNWNEWQLLPQYIVRVRQLALSESIILIDNNSAFGGYDATNFFDGVHPNNTGHQLMADNAINTIMGKQ